MNQVWSLLLAIFAPLSFLARVFEPMLAWLTELEGSLDDPDYIHELQTRASSRCNFEAAVAFSENLANVLVTYRTAEMLGLSLRKLKVVLPRKHWQPRKARSFAGMMQRFARMKRAFCTIERDARRRAARIRREMARGDVTGLVAPAPHAHLVCGPVALICAHIVACLARIAARVPPVRGPPPVSVVAASVSCLAGRAARSHAYAQPFAS